LTLGRLVSAETSLIGAGIAPNPLPTNRFSAIG
jgi:hypothetical protein